MAVCAVECCEILNVCDAFSFQLWSILQSDSEITSETNAKNAQNKYICFYNKSCQKSLEFYLFFPSSSFNVFPFVLNGFFEKRKIKTMINTTKILTTAFDLFLRFFFSECNRPRGKRKLIPAERKREVIQSRHPNVAFCFICSGIVGGIWQNRFWMT